MQCLLSTEKSAEAQQGFVDGNPFLSTEGSQKIKLIRKCPVNQTPVKGIKRRININYDFPWWLHPQFFARSWRENYIGDWSVKLKLTCYQFTLNRKKDKNWGLALWKYAKKRWIGRNQPLTQEFLSFTVSNGWVTCCEMSRPVNWDGYR